MLQNSLPFKDTNTRAAFTIHLHQHLSPSMPKDDNNNNNNGEVASSTATVTNKEKEVIGNGKKPSSHLDVHEHELVGGFSSPITQKKPYLMRKNPYLPPHFLAYSPSPSDEQLTLSPLRHFEPPSSNPKTKKQKHENNLALACMSAPSLLPTYSRVRNTFGNEYYISPRWTPAPAKAALNSKSKEDPPPPPSLSLPTVATAEEEEVEKKTKRDGGGSYVVVSFPTTLPKPTGKGKRARNDNDDSTTNKVTLTMWDQRFDELLDFKKQHGHCNVRQNYAPNPQLGVWVNKQRQEHTKREDGNISALTDERLERLQSIEFIWAKRKGQAGWDEKYEELLQYKAKFGNCHVPTKFKENTALGRWVSQQRTEYKLFCKGEKTSLTTERISRLDSIGFAWWFMF